jgi:membrane-bound lytic murein transglycosylase B
MKLSGSLLPPARSAARWSRRLGVVAVVGAAGVAAAPAQSSAPVGSFALSQQRGHEPSPAQEPAEATVQASSTPALAGPSVVDVPAPALRAYRFAETVLARSDAACGLDWSLLAAIGDVESDHGRYRDAVLHPDGTSTPRVLGPRLDGAGDVAAIADTDEGSLDGDKRWDRAVGPMQFIPSTWSVVGSDADGDGARDPYDLDDAALSAAAYLCAGPDDLSTVDGQRAAVYQYNPSRAYVRLVLRLAASYTDQGVGLSLPSQRPHTAAVHMPALTARIDRPAHPQAPPRESFSDTAPALLPRGPAARHGSDRSSAQLRHVGSDGSGPAPTTHRGTGDGTTGGTTPPPRTAHGGRAGHADPSPGNEPPGGAGSTDGGTTGGGSAGGSTGGGTPAGDGSTGGATPPPAPPPVSGVLQRADDGTWSVAGTAVDLGDAAYLDQAALNDFDGVDGVESNLGELDTLVGHEVTVVLEQDSQVVTQLNNLAYR